MASVNDLAQSIAQYEGYYTAGSIAQRFNNPGNLRSWGSTPVVNGYALFATPEEGWAALRAQVQKNIDRGLTLDEFFGGKTGVYPGYAPAADNNAPARYAATVASWLGISTDAPLADVIGGSTSEDYSTAAIAPVVDSKVLTAAVAVGAVAFGWLLFAR